MKIRVVSFKNTSSYFIKIISLVIITVLFGHFFYSTKNVKASIKIDSSKISNTLNKIMNTEITLFQDVENSKNSNQQKEKYNLNVSFFQKETISQEIELARLANAKNNSNNLNKNQKGNSENKNSGNIENNNQVEPVNNQENFQTDNINQQENISEPTVRSTNRNSFSKCSR